MVKGDEKTSKEIMICQKPIGIGLVFEHSRKFLQIFDVLGPPSEFFPNHPHESKAGGHPLQKKSNRKFTGKRGSGIRDAWKLRFPAPTSLVSWYLF